VPPGFEQWHDLLPAPAAMPSAMNEQIGRHRRRLYRKPELASFWTRRIIGTSFIRSTLAGCR
jgi:hypothetical protein